MKVVTAEQMQEIDRSTITRHGIPGEVLMGFAGKSAADFCLEHILNDHSKKHVVAVFCGPGNNGGDGFVIAYFLANAGINTHIFLTGNKDRVSAASKIYMDLCASSGLLINEVTDAAIGSIDFSGYWLIIDAMLGTGFQGTVRGIIADVITRMNKSGTRVLAVDIPSGLPSNGEAPLGEVVYARYTVTIGLPKISLVTFPGKEYTGELSIADIGFPRSLTESDELKTELVTGSFLRKYIPLPEEINNFDSDIHKGDRGHLLLIGGFDSMEGAIMMTAASALETGVGLISLLTTEKARSIIAGKIPELITLSIKDSIKDPISPTSNPCAERSRSIEPRTPVLSGAEASNLSSLKRSYDALVIGPGMGRSALARKIFFEIMDSLTDFGIRRVLIDGDGLFHLVDYLKENKTVKTGPGLEYIITPHFFEASRLMEKEVSEIKRNRLQAAKELARITGSTCLLKGPATIISDCVNSYINSSGCPALATGGSGDVLSGITGALMLKNLPITETAALGAFIHGKAAELFCSENGTDTLKATDVIEYIRKVQKESLKFNV
ncbi:MAG: NAD(P)H-hydrate dehydratase [bacterium]|nr:NAD(P)H-hydrate dehydratase [bacterium]